MHDAGEAPGDDAGAAPDDASPPPVPGTAAPEAAAVAASSQGPFGSSGVRTLVVSAVVIAGLAVGAYLLVRWRTAAGGGG